MSALYWLPKEEVGHSKLNSLLEPVESLGVEEVAHIKKRTAINTEQSGKGELI